MVWDVVVIGAGMAGLACARQLQPQYRVLVLDKGRGVGGRVATRRIGTTRVDHGCRYLQATSPFLQELIETLQRQQELCPWQPQVGQLTAAGNLTPAPAAAYWVAPAGMTAVAKWLARDLEVRQRSLVEALIPTPDRHWRIQIAATPEQPTTAVVAKALVVAIPAPQAANLVRAAHLSQPGEPEDPVLKRLEQVVYAPSIAVMAGYTVDLSPRWKVNKELDGWMILGHPQTPFAWMGLDSAKRSLSSSAPPPTSLVIHSSAGFAQPWLKVDGDDLAIAARELLDHANAYFHQDLKNYQWMQVHRWRYATVNTPASKSVPITVPYSIPLVLAGDWTHGNTVGDALESGIQAAHHLQRQL
jgi:renalase